MQFLWVSGSGLEPVGPPNRGFPQIKRTIMGVTKMRIIVFLGCIYGGLTYFRNVPNVCVRIFVKMGALGPCLGSLPG